MSRTLAEEAELFHEHGVHLPTRTIYINGDPEVGINHDMVASITKNLHVLDTMREGEINILFNCDGGDTILGMAIYDAIKACKNFVRIKVMGHASSMGSIVLQAADERVVAANAVIMIHMGTVSYHGHHKTTDAWRAYDKYLDKIHEDIYLEKIKMKKPRFTRENLQKLLEHDTIFTAQQAVDLGLADKILEIP